MAAYQKPWPSQWCESTTNLGKDCYYNLNREDGKADPLAVWSVDLGTLAVSFGVPNHHCVEDECYYMPANVFDEHIKQEFQTFGYAW